MLADGNDETQADPTWASTDEISFDMGSAVTGTTRHHDRLSDSLMEDLDARVWSGLHFRNSMDEGAELGLDVAELVTETLFGAT